jgi:hypothetical protein
MTDWLPITNPAEQTCKNRTIRAFDNMDFEGLAIHGFRFKETNFLFNSFLVILFFVCCSVLPVKIKSQQVEVLAVNIPTTVVSIEDVLSGVVVQNNKSEPTSKRLMGKLFTQEGRPLMSILVEGEASSGIGTLDKLNLISVQDFTGGSIKSYLDETGLLSIRGVKLCIYEEGLESKPLECSTSDEHRSQLLNLQYPYDEETVNSTRPSLFWTFSGHSSLIRYQVSLKHKSGKSNIEALNFGRTLFMLDNVTDQLVDYPIGIEDLLEGESYVWQVEAFLGDISLGITDIWAFSVGKPLDEENIPITKSYVDINEIKGEPILYVLGNLKLKLIESDRPSSINLNISKVSDKKQKVVSKETLEVKMGENYYDVNLADNYPVRHKKKYRVTISRKSTNMKVIFHVVYLNPNYFNHQ